MNLHDLKVSFGTVWTHLSSTRTGDLTCHIDPAHATECTKHSQGEGYTAPVMIGNVSDDRPKEYYYVRLVPNLLRER